MLAEFAGIRGLHVRAEFGYILAAVISGGACELLWNRLTSQTPSISNSLEDE
jgi:hypothetical protein